MTRRNTPSIANRAFGASQFWDGRAQTLEIQALGPIFAANEMASSPEAVQRYLLSSEVYREKFQAAFGSSPTVELAASAIAAYERTLVATDSQFDRYEWAGDSEALSADALRGLNLFRGKARCSLCHAGVNFTDEMFHALGISGDNDPGRFEVTKDPSMRGAFKTPSLRNVAETAPYMHDGSIRTLAQVVSFYNKGGGHKSPKDPLMLPLRLSRNEERDLVAFLCALNSRVVSLGPGAWTKARESHSASTRKAPFAEAAPRATSTLRVEVLSNCIPSIKPLVNRKHAATCGESILDERSLWRNGRLANVAVWIADQQLENRFHRVPRLHLLEVAKCRFAPRVQVVCAGDSLAIINSDPVLHNPHARNSGRTVFNVALAPGAPRNVRTIHDEGLYEIACDVHEWMRAYLVVVPSQFGGVTDEDGVATIAGLSAGSYDLVVWHEVLGRKTVKIVVTPDADVTTVSVTMPEQSLPGASK